MGLLVLLTLTFAAIRAMTDWPHALAGTVPDEDSFEYRYVVNFVLGHGHIVLGVVYLLAAPLQLWRGFRSRHYRVHRRLGRVVLTVGMSAGVLGVVVGTLFPFGGPVEGAAAVIFGHYFVISLAVAFLAIRRGDVDTHRRWMIRAFAVAVGVGTIRIWIGLFFLLGLTFEHSFAAAFWVAFPVHVLAAEIYVRMRPTVNRVAEVTI